MASPSPDTTYHRVKGAAWSVRGRWLRSAYTINVPRQNPLNGVGFRVFRNGFESVASVIQS